MKRQGLAKGLFLILLGIVWILKTAGVINLNLFHAVGQLWPLFLIGIGFSIVFKDKKSMAAIVWVIILISIVVYGAFFPDKLRNTIKDVMAAEGITLEDLKDIMEKAKSATH